MAGDGTAELVLSAEGEVKNIVFVEELVSAAPKMDGWLFTALKPALSIKDVNIDMAGHKFNGGNISFYPNEIAGYPDEIAITIVHDELNAGNKAQIINGTYIFLDSLLGELDFVNTIDDITVIGKDEAQKELVPIAKLKDFLVWRQKEFVEKYEGTRYDTDNDNYSMLEAELENGNPLLAIVNAELLKWDKKASHPWLAVLSLRYDGSNNNGMPNEDDYALLNEMEEKLMLELKDVDGYLNVGRQTADGERRIYFACKDFRRPSKMFFKAQQTYSATFEIGYDIYKDKYWQSLRRFMTN